MYKQDKATKSKNLTAFHLKCEEGFCISLEKESCQGGRIRYAIAVRFRET
jgi:hypothetical protein